MAMEKRRASGPLLILALLASTACGGGSSGPTSPSQRVGYAGEWSGSSFQGDTIAFSVSGEQRVTTISITYRFNNGCSGTRTFSGLSLEIAGLPGVGPTFAYQTADGDARNFIGLQVTFSSPDAATGITIVDNFAGCSGGAIVWSARRR